MNSLQIMETWLEEVGNSKNIHVKKIPLSVGDFLLWLVRSQTKRVFIFDNLSQAEVFLEVYVDAQGVAFQLKMYSEAIQKENEGRLLKRVSYLNDDDFLQKVQKITFRYYLFDIEYMSWEKESLALYKELTPFCDASLSKLYNKLSADYRFQKRFEEAQKDLKTRLPEIASVFGLQGNLKKVDVRMELPSLLKESGKQEKIKITLDYKNLTERDLAALLVEQRERWQKIKLLLEPYLDLSIYVLNATCYAFHFYVSGNSARVEIELYFEAISGTDYDATIGRVKLVLKNVCSGKFSSADLQGLAEELKVNVEDLPYEEVCRVLWQRVSNLKLKDFQ